MTEREKAIRQLVAEKVVWSTSTSSDIQFLLSVIDSYRNALQRCADGAFIFADRKKLINVAKQALEGDDYA